MSVIKQSINWFFASIGMGTCYILYLDDIMYKNLRDGKYSYFLPTNLFFYKGSAKYTMIKSDVTEDRHDTLNDYYSYIDKRINNMIVDNDQDNSNKKDNYNKKI